MTTKRLLQQRPGSFAWQEGLAALQWWARNTIYSPYNQQHPNHKQRFTYACQLLERLLEEKNQLYQRLEKLQGAMDASAMLDHCYELNANELLGTIVKNYWDEGNPQQELIIAEWVHSLSERFQLQPCPQVVSLIQKKSKEGVTEQMNMGPTPQQVFDSYEISTAEDFTPSQEPAASKETTDSDRLVGRLLLDFVRDWTDAGLDSKDAQKRVDHFYMDMKRTITNANTNNQLWVREAYIFVLNAWKDAASQKPELAAKHADKTLYEMLTNYLEDNDKNEQFKPTRDCFASVISARTLCGDAEETDRVLQDMITLYNRTGDPDFCPDRRCFLSVFYSLFNSHLTANGNGNGIMVGKADHLLRQMLDIAESIQDTSLIPPVSVFEHILALWARTHEKDAGERVEVVMLRMQQLYDNGKLHAKPSLKFFELLLQSWANSHRDDAAERVEKIRSFVIKNFGKLGDLWEGPIPPTFGYLSLIQAWSRWNYDQPELALEKTEHYFQKLREHFESDLAGSLDIILAYKARINAYGNIRNATKAAEMAQEALEELEQLRMKEIIDRNPDSSLYGSVANYWAKVGNVKMIEKIIQLQPEDQLDTVMYNCLLQAHARSKDPRAGEKAEKILQQMEKASQEGNESVKPNNRTFGMVITCLSNSPDPARVERAEKYLQALKDIYAATGDENYQPNARIYTMAMRALTKSGKLDQAEALLHEMNALADIGHKHVRPDTVTYTVVLKGLRTANIPDKIERTKEILRMMQKHDTKADAFVEQEIRKITAGQ